MTAFNFIPGALLAGEFFGSSQFLILGMMFIVIFMMVIPGRKEQKLRAKMQEELKKGDKVLTQAGIVGKITENRGETVTLETHGTRMEMLRSVIVKVIVDKDPAAKN